MKYQTPNTRFRVFLLLLCAVALLAFSDVLRHPSASVHLQASVTTNKADYLPGETVTITGSGWQAGETVALTIVETDNDAPWQSSGLADDAGNISNSAFVIQDHDGGVSFTLTATGGSSGQTATATFTDTQATLGLGRVSSVTPTDGGCVHQDDQPTTSVESWDVEQGKTYTVTLTNVTDCATGGTDATIQVIVLSSDNGNQCLTANKTANTGEYTFTVTIPSTGCNTSPILYCTSACSASTGMFARRSDGEDKESHLRAATFDGDCNETGLDTDCTAPSPSPTPTPSPQGCTIDLPPPDKDLGCNPTTIPGNQTLMGTCDGNTVTATYSASDTSTDCNHTRVNTWTITCGQTSCDVSQTVTWTVDTMAPVITATGTTLTIGCNPSSGSINAALGTATATDNCSSVTPTPSDSAITSTGCSRSQTRTWNVTDACGNAATPVSRTVTWTEDTTPPTIGNAGDNATIFCPSQPVFTPPGATDGCSTPAVIQDSDVTTQGSCGTYSRTVTWHAQDACGNVSPQRSQTIVVECNNCGGLTMGFWQNKNGQGIISSSAPDGLRTFLLGYNPFKDLSVTATPAQVATYVYNVIKAANATGSSMNAMLKAQMLATALDVYFNKINGSVHIDLTHICKIVDSGGVGTCSAVFYDVSAAFTTVAPCPTVLQMLTYASNQAAMASLSNTLASPWYAQVKTTQEMAKNAFDNINNNLAFACFP